MGRFMCLSVLVKMKGPVSTPSLSWCQRKYLHTTMTKLSNDLFFNNPVDRLQPYCQVPLIPETNHVFNPTQEEIEEGSLFFEPRNYKNEFFKFLGSYPNPHIMPKSNVPEVAFIGKSNVGKSSLLAKLFTNIPELKVRTSSKPGHTKLMNMFKVNDNFHLIDMPGYGFNMPKDFDFSVEAYLQSRRSVMTFILFDGSVGMTRNDQTYFKKYCDLNIPLAMVLTKVDLANTGTLIRNLTKVLKFKEESGAHSCFPQPFLVSARTGEGIALLQTFIAYVTGNMKIQSI